MNVHFIYRSLFLYFSLSAYGTAFQTTLRRLPARWAVGASHILNHLLDATTPLLYNNNSRSPYLITVRNAIKQSLLLHFVPRSIQKITFLSPLSSVAPAVCSSCALSDLSFSPAVPPGLAPGACDSLWRGLHHYHCFAISSRKKRVLLTSSLKLPLFARPLCSSKSLTRHFHACAMKRQRGNHHLAYLSLSLG